MRGGNCSTFVQDQTFCVEWSGKAWLPSVWRIQCKRDLDERAHTPDAHSSAEYIEHSLNLLLTFLTTRSPMLWAMNMIGPCREVSTSSFYDPLGISKCTYCSQFASSGESRSLPSIWRPKSFHVDGCGGSHERPIRVVSIGVDVDVLETRFSGKPFLWPEDRTDIGRHQVSVVPPPWL